MSNVQGFKFKLLCIEYIIQITIRLLLFQYYTFYTILKYKLN